jgi:hypothetical protein
LRRSATLRVAGRTLGQLLVPFECTVAPHRRGDQFGAAIATAPPALSHRPVGVRVRRRRSGVAVIRGGTAAYS